MALRLLILLLALPILSCGSSKGDATSGNGATNSPRPTEPDQGSPEKEKAATSQGKAKIVAIPAEAQRAGDPERGYTALINNNYVGCGVPRSLLDRFVGPVPSHRRLEGRKPGDEDLPYYLNGYETEDGSKLVTANCLSCHGSFFGGQFIMGRGEIWLDFSEDASTALTLASLVPATGQAKEELARLLQRVRALAPYIRTKAIGSNPGDAIAAVLFAHRDPKTLAWSDEFLRAEPIKTVAPVDVPPWWHMQKKNAMFYTAAGRGDHARIMMTASALCTDSVEKAKEIDRYFPDVRAFISSIEAPKWHWEVDRAKAERGKEIFSDRCEPCHGSYGSLVLTDTWGPAGKKMDTLRVREPTDEEQASDPETYPNLVIPLQEIKTDSALAVGTGQFAGPYIEWFSESFYGEISRLAPERGYVAPPLDGIWITAPYFHNGSVPTLAGVLNSKSRPKNWRRVTGSLDMVGIGLEHEEVPEKELDIWGSQVFRTGLPGHGNGGHTYGDTLREAERSDLIEYLKTL